MPRYELIEDCGCRYDIEGNDLAEALAMLFREPRNSDHRRPVEGGLLIDETDHPVGEVTIFVEIGQLHVQFKPGRRVHRLVLPETGPPRLEQLPVLNRAMRKEVARATGSRHLPGCKCRFCGSVHAMMAMYPDIEPSDIARSAATLRAIIDRVPLDTVIRRDLAGLCGVCGEPAAQVGSLCDEHWAQFDQG